MTGESLQRESLVLTIVTESLEMVLRTARKAHHCCTARKGTVRGWDGGPFPPEHTGQILPGEQYVEYFGESAAYQSGFRYCGACAKAAGLIATRGNEP